MSQPGNGAPASGARWARGRSQGALGSPATQRSRSTTPAAARPRPPALVRLAASFDHAQARRLARPGGLRALGASRPRRALAAGRRPQRAPTTAQSSPSRCQGPGPSGKRTQRRPGAKHGTRGGPTAQGRGTLPRQRRRAVPGHPWAPASPRASRPVQWCACDPERCSRPLCWRPGCRCASPRRHQDSLARGCRRPRRRPRLAARGTTGPRSGAAGTAGAGSGPLARPRAARRRQGETPRLRPATQRQGPASTPGRTRLFPGRSQRGAL